MPRIVPIVEGQGEVEAVPVLLQKILDEQGRSDVRIAPPQNVYGVGNLTTSGGLEKFIALCLTEAECDAILILLDADKECPVTLARKLTARAEALKARCPVVIVVAKCEYEAWFLASLETIAGQPLGERTGLPTGLIYSQDVEARVGVKGWLDNQFPPGRSYKPTLDQALMTEMIDTGLAAQRSRSFRRLCHAVEEVLAAIDGGQTVITPTVA